MGGQGAAAVLALAVATASPQQRPNTLPKSSNTARMSLHYADIAGLRLPLTTAFARRLPAWSRFSASPAPRSANLARSRISRRGSLWPWHPRWQQFGNVREYAYALLGQGRCLVALEDPAAEQPLRQAAELFSSMGYRPALAETEALLERTSALAS